MTRPEPGSWEAAMEEVPKPKRTSKAHTNARNRGKVWEREAAKDLGTKRTGPTGMDDSDLLHETLGVECKALAKLAFRAAHWAQTKRNAKGRIPVLAIKEMGTGERIAIVSWDYFVSLHTDKEKNGA